MPPPAPEPLHVLRTQTAQAATLSFSADNARLYAGDVAGRVVVTSTRLLRPLAAWSAHTLGILGVEEWREEESGWIVITHGRDNKLSVWRIPRTAEAVGSAANANVEQSTPELLTSVDVNALNFCRFSLVREEDGRALVAVPNLVNSSLVDVWELPGGKRLHAAVGSAGGVSVPFSDGRGGTGILMALHLFCPAEGRLHVLMAHEDGSVALHRFGSTDRTTSVEGTGWDKLWSVKLHVESIMALAVTRDGTLALSVSADHLVGRYDLTNGTHSVHRTKHPGNAAIAIRDDGRVCAIAGWDGRVRLYSTKSLRPLGTLAYHREGCQAVALAHDYTSGTGTNVQVDGEDDSDGEEEQRERARWLASAGKDGRIVLWPLIDFESGKTRG